MTLIIEKKSSVIDPLKVRIPSNYVLVLPDKTFDTYQLSGKETGIMVGRSIERDVSDDDSEEGLLEERVDNLAQHFSVKGKVFSVCEKLLYRKDLILKLRERFGNNHSDMAELGYQTNICVDYDTDIEVSVGDEVMFDYLEHIACYEDGRVIETELGDMYLIRYDALFIALKPDGSKVPLNGWVAIKRILAEKVTEHGIVVPLFSKDYFRVGKHEYAEVLDVGSPLRGMKEDFNYSDGPDHISSGDKVVYRPGGSYSLEWALHQVVYPGIDARIVRRKDILFKHG